jgi:hypothetical protein
MRRLSLSPLLLVCLSLPIGCAAPPAPRQPSTITWCDDIAFGGPLWQVEAERKFPGQRPVVVVCHGTYDPDSGEWMLQPDPPREPVPVLWAARTLRNLYPPRRPIVLVVCNKRAHDLDVPGVWFGRERVWVVPDDLDPLSRPSDPEVGSIFEMEEGGPATRPTH